MEPDTDLGLSSIRMPGLANVDCETARNRLGFCRAFAHVIYARDRVEFEALQFAQQPLGNKDLVGSYGGARTHG